MKAILRSINNFSCKLKQSKNLKYNISPKIRSNKFKSISGNGNIVIEDAIKKYLKDYRVYGNIVQSKLPSGYTQVDYIESSGTQYIDTGWYPDYSKKFEIEATINPQVSNKRYCILSNYLNTSEYNLSLETNINNKVRFYINSSTTNDLISSNTIETNKFTTIKFNYNENDSKYSILMNGISSEKTTNVSKEKLSLSTYLFLDQGQRVTVFNNSLQLKRISIKENDKLIRDFVPCYRNSDNEVGLYDIVNNVFYTNQGTGVFTYGSIAPTPDAPIEMVSCGDRTKNLLQLPDLANQTYRAIYTKIDDNSFKIEPDGTAGATGYARLDLTDLVKPNTTYTFSRTISKIGYNFINGGSARVDINGTLGSIIDTDSFNIVVPSTITRVWLYLYIAIDDNNLSSQTGSVTFNNVMLEENSTSTPYEPYGYKIPVNVRSENLFDIDTISNIGGGTNNNGIITSTTRSTSGTINLNFKFSDILVKAGETLYFSADIKLNNDSIGTFSTINDNVHAGATKIIYSTLNNKYQRYQTSYTYSNDETVKSMLIQIGNLLGSFEVSNIMISKDDSIIYKPYYNETTNIYLDEPLRKSDDGTYVDHIDFQNKKVYRQIKEITLNGTEAWSRVSAKNSHYRFRVNRSDLKIGAECVLYCTHFKNNGDSYSHEGISGSTGNILYIRWDELFETVDDLKTWLASNTPIVDYVLETPIEEDIELPNINLIEGKNIISIGTEVQGVFEAEYYSKEIIDISDYKYNLRKVED